MSQSMPLAILLTLAGGFQDAYSYNSRGHVFANAQTGNIVLFAQNLMSAQFSQALHYLLPVLAFILGVYISEKIHQKYKYSHLFHWRQLVLVSEIFLLILAGFLKTDMIANVLLSFACAMQVQTFRKVDSYAFASTMCIGNLRSGMAALSAFMRNHKKQQLEQVGHYFGVIFLFAVGAGIGGNLSIHYGVPVIWGSCILLLISFCLMFAEQIE